MIIVSESGIVFAQRSDDIFMSSKEYDHYLKWLIVGQALVNDTVDYRSEIRVLRNQVKILQKDTATYKNDIALDKVKNSADSTQLGNCNKNLTTANNNVEKEKKWKKVFRNTTIIFICTTVIEAVIIYFTVKIP